MSVLEVLKFIAALILVLSLIGGFGFLANRFNLLSNMGRRGGAPRLKVQESLAIDAKHRMMIVTSDAREHVLLLGPAGDLVVESRDINPASHDQSGGRSEDRINTHDSERIIPLLKEGNA